MQLVKLTAANFKRLTAVQITPQGHIVELRGANEAGKSSVIDALAAALGGKRLCPAHPIRRGAERAEVEVDLGNLIIKRTWTANSTYLTVRNRDGAEYRSPQKMLDDLVGSLTFDPLAFARMDQEKQREVLLDLLGLADQMEASLAAEKSAMEVRKEVAASVKLLEAQIKGIVVPEGTPEDEVDVVQISTDLRAAEATIEDHNIEESALDNLRAVTIRMKDAVADEEQSLVRAETELDEMIQRAKDRMDEIRTAIAGNKAVIDTQQTEYNQRLDAWTPFEWPETAALEAKLASANKVNADVSKLRQRGELQAGLAVTRGTLDDANTAVSKIRLDRKAMLVGADFPVPGMGFDDDGVTYDGLPFGQASQARRLRISTAVGMKNNPEICILSIRDGSLLDASARQALYDLVEEHGFQLLIEIVGTDGLPTEVVIEDGHIQGCTDVACSSCSKIIPRDEAYVEPEGPGILCEGCCETAERDASNADAEDEQAAAEPDADLPIGENTQPTPGSEEMDADPVE